MRSRIVVFVAACAVLVGAVLPTQASAWEKGHTKINPFVKYEQQWDDNIFYDENSPKHDFVSILTPGITSEFGFGDNGKHKVRANYDVELGMFAYYNSQNYGNHDVNGDVELNLGENYRWTTGDRFLFTSDRAGTEFQARTLRKENTLHTLFEADYNKLSGDIGYSLYNVDYLSDSLKAINRYENAFWTTGYFEVQPKTKGLLELKYTNIQYPDASGRNGNDYRVMTGIKGDITAKITGIAKVGFEVRDYNGNSSTPTWTQPAAEVAIDYRFNDRMDFLVSYLRGPFESTYNNNNYYTGDHFTGALNYKFGNGFFAVGDGQFFRNDYPESGAGVGSARFDYEWAAGGKLGYEWKKWIVVDAGYRFHSRDSNVTGRSYDENVISASIKAMY